MVDHGVDALLDDAIRSYPLAALPPDFVVRTMARVGTERRRAPADAASRPRLGFLDLALPGFAALLTAVVVGAVSWAWRLRDPLATAVLGLRIRLEWLSLVQRWAPAGAASLTPLVIVAMAGVAAIGAAAVLTLALRRPHIAA
jgi:hypothetical protein